MRYKAAVRYNIDMNSIIAWVGTDCNSVACDVQVTVGLLLVVILPFIAGGAIIGSFAHFVYKYIRARKNKDKKTVKQYKKILLIAVSIVVLFIGQAVLGAYFYERGRNQNVLNAGFTIYATPGQKVDVESLRYNSDLAVPHVNSRLNTPLGDIKITQGRFDSETKDLFIPPNRCDIDELYNYFGVYGKDNKSPTNIECIGVTNNSDWIILKTKESGKFDNRAPYAALQGETIIVFHAFKSSFGEFSGTAEQAAEFVTKFLKEAKAVEPKTLL